MNNIQELIAIGILHWYYVEWSPLGAFRAVTVEDAHYRNYCACKRREAVGYEPIGLFPTFESALDHIRYLKRMRRDQRHDKQEATGVGAAGSGAEAGGAEYSVLEDDQVRGRWDGESGEEAGCDTRGDADSGESR
jgi:hypothetical protein